MIYCDTSVSLSIIPHRTTVLSITSSITYPVIYRYRSLRYDSSSHTYVSVHHNQFTTVLSITSSITLAVTYRYQPFRYDSLNTLASRSIIPYRVIGQKIYSTLRDDSAPTTPSCPSCKIFRPKTRSHNRMGR